MREMANYVVVVLVAVASCLMGKSWAEAPLIEENANGILGAFGDFDSDKLTDVLVIGSKGTAFSILRAYKKEPLIRVYPKWGCALTQQQVEAGESIVSLMPGDFHGLATMDVLVVTTSNAKINNKKTYKVYLATGNKQILDCRQIAADKPLATVFSEPLLLDFNGDMIMDFLSQAVDGQRYIWQFAFNASFSRISFDGNQTIADPNSNAFVDLNHDDVPDMFVTGEKNMEYRFMGKEGFEQEANAVKIPYDDRYAFQGQSAFFDLNSDSLIDHVMPVCKSKACDSSAIVALANNYQWEVLSESFADTDNSSQSLNFVPQRDKDGIIFPVALRFADVDGDGYADLITLMRVNGRPEKVVILINVANSSNLFGRSFVPKWTIKLPEGRQPYLASFFDLYEDGRADILVTSLEKGEWRLNAEVNTQMVDACFLKVMVASGLCFEDCPSIRSNPNSLDTSNPPYGTNVAGPTVCYKLIDTEGNRRHACQGQLSQSGHFALQMPYAIFGLGSLPNFVDDLSATIPSEGTLNKRQQTWTQIVPDAQVVLIPYPLNDPKQWRSKLFLTPSDIVLSTLITLASICCLLVLIIAVLHRKEIMEDLAEHEEYKRHWPDSR